MTTPENPYNGNPYTPGTGQPADETQQFGQPAQQPYGAPQDEPMQAMPEYGQMQPNPYAAPEQPMQSFDYSQQGQQCVSASWRPQYGHYFSAAQAAGFQQEPHRRNPPPLFPWLSGHEGVLAAV